MPVQLSDPAQLEGAKVVDPDGGRLGTVQAVYFDAATERPEWAAVKTGWFGGDHSLVPLATAEFDGAELTVPYEKARLEAAPHHSPGHDLSAAEEAELFEHYGIAYHETHGVEEVAMGTDAVDREHVDRSDDPERASERTRLRRHG